MVILTYLIKAVSYYLSKTNMILQYYQALKNIRTRVKQRIHAVYMYENDFLMTCNSEIISVGNTLNKIYLIITILNEFISTYYDYKNDVFPMLFKQFTENSVDNIDQLVLIQ